MKDKTRILLFSILISVAFLTFSSCNQNPAVLYGKLSINMESSKSIEVDREKYELTSFTVYAVYQNGVDTIEETFTTASYTIDQMKAGLWEVHIKGFNSDGTYIAVSEKQVVEIVPASNNSATFDLDYLTLDNDGSFSLKITIPAGYVDISRIIGTITQGSIVADKSFDESERTNDGDVDYFIWEGNLAPGTYNLRVELFDLNGNPHDIAHLETIRIAPNEETSGLIAVEEKHLPVDIPVITEEIDGYTSRITITTTTKGAKIYYTTDGSIPTTSKTEYTGIVETDLTIRFRAVALKDNIKKSENSTYETKKGPAGGYVFYDCDADNTIEDPDGADNLLSTTCGWRYLEAAPADLRVVSGTPTVDSAVAGYASATKGYKFGYYRTTSSGSNLYVNGTTSYSESNCTGTLIGTGKTNTEKLVKAMGTSAYSSSSGTGTTPDYAARLCSVLSYGGYDDWFLPSIDELDAMYDNLNASGIGLISSGSYWSSTENDSGAKYARYRNFGSGGVIGTERGSVYYILPCRAF